MEETKNKSLKIALDTMGGDFAPRNEILGAIEVFNDSNFSKNLEIVFYGDEEKIKNVLKETPHNKLKYSIVHTDEVISMLDDPTESIKTKKNSSLYRGIESVAKGDANAFVSAGNTGAVMSISTVLMHRIKGVSRPTIATFIPSDNIYPVLIIDAGANVDCKPLFLYEFAVMGNIYVKQLLGIERPRVGLLSIGEEEKKGNEAVREAHKLIKNDKSLNFIGNVEGKDILSGNCDIVVCDGFTGNVILKLAESFAGFVKKKFKDYANNNIKNKILVGVAMPALKSVFASFNYEDYGGVPLLGVNGVTIIGHGKSTPKAIKNMIIRAVESVQKQVNIKIEKALNEEIIS